MSSDGTGALCFLERRDPSLLFKDIVNCTNRPLLSMQILTISLGLNVQFSTSCWHLREMRHALAIAIANSKLEFTVRLRVTVCNFFVTTSCVRFNFIEKSVPLYSVVYLLNSLRSLQTLQQNCASLFSSRDIQPKSIGQVRYCIMALELKTSFNYCWSGSDQNSVITVVCDVPE